MTKREEKLQRAIAIRNFALKLLGEKGLWQQLFNGPEVLRFEDTTLLVIFHVKQPVPVEMRNRFGLDPLAWGLYSLELWDRGKVLNLEWDTVGAVPRIVTFRRGEWEERLLIG